MESHRAFNRSIYHLHQELEFAVPFESTFEASRRFMELYESMYRKRSLPYTLFEVRFTPPGHHCTLLGPGREWHATWIDLVCNDSSDFERFYAAAEELVRTIGGRPHLGKFCEQLDHRDLARLHGKHFETFRSVVDQSDPRGVFRNAFTTRMFGPP